MKKYRAIKRGYDGIVVREVGDVFEFAGKPGSWMEPIEDKKVEVVEEIKPKEKAKPKLSPGKDLV